MRFGFADAVSQPAMDAPSAAWRECPASGIRGGCGAQVVRLEVGVEVALDFGRAQEHSVRPFSRKDPSSRVRFNESVSRASAKETIDQSESASPYT